MQIVDGKQKLALKQIFDKFEYHQSYSSAFYIALLLYAIHQFIIFRGLYADLFSPRRAYEVALFSTNKSIIGLST